MTALDTTLSTTEGDLVPATDVPSHGSVPDTGLPAAEIVVDGNVVGSGQDLPVGGTIILDATQFATLLTALDAVMSAVDLVAGANVDASDVVVDSTLLTTLKTSPGGPFANMAAALTVINDWVASLADSGSGATPVFGFFDFAMDAGTWGILESDGDPGTYLIDRVTGGGAPAPGIYTLASATWTLVRALVPNELIEAQVAVDSSFTPEGPGPFLYCVRGDGTVAVPTMPSERVYFVGVGRQSGVEDVATALRQFEGDSDNRRFVIGYMGTEPDTSLTDAGVADEDQPMLDNGVQAVPGWFVAVTAPTDDAYLWAYYVYPGTDDDGSGFDPVRDPVFHGQWLSSPAGDMTNPWVPTSTNERCGTSMFVCPNGTRGDFAPDGDTPGLPLGGPGHQIAGSHVGQWCITPPGTLTGSGAPAGTLGEDGWTYEDTDNLDQYVKVAGVWKQFTLAGLV